MNFGKKILLSLVVTGATTGLAFAAGGQGQGSGQVQFHGYIIDAPCSIVSDDPIKVEFGQISKKALSVNDNTGESHIKPFNIELADCTFDDGTSGSYVGNQLTVTFSYNDAGNATGQVTNLVGFDGAANMGAGVVIVSGNTKVENNKALPPRLLQAGPNTLEFSSYVKGIGIKDTATVPGIQTGEFYASANFALAYE